MSTPAVERPGTDPDEPMLALSEVRAELEKVTDVRHFDRWVEVAVQRAEREGNFSKFREELRGWLRTALAGQNQDLVLATPYEQRGELLERMVDQWAAEHPPHTNFA